MGNIHTVGPNEALIVSGMKDQRCSYPRGKGLGGSTLINYMMYVRGNKYDYDQWAAAGNEGWSYDEILPYFMKSEKSYLREVSKYHGTDGNLDVRYLPYRTRLAKLFVNAWRELGLESVDYNGESQIGASYIQSNVRNGRRLTAYTAFLEPILDRPNLHILTNARATRVLIDPTTQQAYGVEFIKDRNRYTVYAEKEILLTAGALQTPQLLMLSGVGPKDHLQEIGIPVLKDLPVGQTLYDHIYFTGLAFVTNTTNLSLHGDNVLTLDAFLSFLQGQGPMTVTGGVEAVAFIRNTTNPESAATPATLPNIEYILTGGSQAADHGSGIRSGFRLTDTIYSIYKPLEANERDAMTVNIVLLHPKSKGYLRLKSCNPLHWPRFYSNSLKEPEDVETILQGIRSALPLMNTRTARRYDAKLYDVPLPNCASFRFGTDDYWRCAIRTQTTSIHHQISTCKMGPSSDPTAVVSSQLKVYGVNRLRVADVGVIPYPTSGHPTATAYMIGEKLSDLIKTEWLGQNIPTATGGCCGSTKKRTIVGGWAWAWWLVTDVQRLSLEVMTLNPMCEMVETAQGVPLTVTGVAQCKIMKMMNVYYFHHQADELLGTASEQFLGKSVNEIKMTILQTLEGHLRAILGTLTVEEVYKDRDQFAALVREVAAPDVGRMGIEILSFTIKDVYDDVQYLQSLGKAQTASVKRDADAGVAEANRDAGIREAECEKSAMDVKYSTDTKIEDNARMYKLQKANFDQEINTAKAESQLAYELQAAKIRQRIRNEEIQIDIVERRKQIEIETQEINRKDCELSATVKLPAEAESYRVQTIAEGKRTQTVETARAEAERIKKIGSAEAYAIEQVGKAEAERMRMKANVYKMYGDAAIMNIVLESLPKIAAEVAAPLAKTEEIVLIGGNDQTTGDVTRLVGQLPPAINALTGVDLSKVLGKIPGAKA